jgi:hypothetical protein
MLQNPFFMSAGKRIQDDFDPDLLDEVLRLIRDCYGSADKSVHFLEVYAGVSAINSGIANQRDCFSHLVTLLKNPDFTAAQKREQIDGMREHLRRAVLEPPMIAVNMTWEKFEAVKDQYRETVLTLDSHETAIPGCPSWETVSARSAAILKLREKARAGKGENRWDAAWEVACADAVQAFQLLNDMKRELETYIAEAKRIRDRRAQTRDSRRQIWMGVWGIVIGIVVSALFFALGG